MVCPEELQSLAADRRAKSNRVASACWCRMAPGAAGAATVCMWPSGARRGGYLPSVQLRQRRPQPALPPACAQGTAIELTLTRRPTVARGRPIG